MMRPPSPLKKKKSKCTCTNGQLRIAFSILAILCMAINVVWERSDDTYNGGRVQEKEIKFKTGVKMKRGSGNERGAYLAAQIQRKLNMQSSPHREAVKAPLKKPVPAIMCARIEGKTCSIHSCTNRKLNQTVQNLPDFLRAYPSAHYGYGFVHRESLSLRGLPMQTSGAAKAGSGCAMSHRYKFIFVHVLKSGGTTMKGFLQDGLCGNTDLPCATGSDNLQIVNCAAAIVKYPQYFVFTFVRNPYSRLYSGYAMAHAYRNHPERPLPPFSFETFALAKKVAAAPGPTNSTGNTTTVVQRRRLQESVGNASGRIQKSTISIRKHLRGERISRMPNKNVFRKTLSYLHPSHYEQQTNYLFSKQGCPVVDFIGHLESMHEDLRTVLTYIDSPELWKHLEKRSRQDAAKKATVVTDNSTAFGSRLGGSLQDLYGYKIGNGGWSAIQKAVADEYKRDFELLGYDPNVIPAS